jgi:hypothetical protein
MHKGLDYAKLESQNVVKFNLEMIHSQKIRILSFIISNPCSYFAMWKKLEHRVSGLGTRIFRNPNF